MSLLKKGKVRGIRFAPLESICEFLQCQPGDLFVYEAPTTDDDLRPTED